MSRTIALALLAGFLALAALADPTRDAPSAAADPSVESMVEALRAKPLTRSLAGSRSGGVSALGEGKLQLSVHFDLDSATLKPESRPLLAKLASAMMTSELARLEFRIEGHTDSTGGGAYNLLLSQRRAQAVRDYLVTQGVDGGRLGALGMGSAKPADPANPAAAANRRVLIVSREPLAAAPSLGVAPAAVPVAASKGRTEGSGTVEQVLGEVQVRRGPSSSIVSQGTRVREGDVLASARGAGAIVRLDDGAKLLLRAESVLRITRLKLSGDTSTWSQAFNLVVGAFRYVTGALGGNRPGAVTFATATATVGIRGTDIDVVHKPEAGGWGEPGTYVKVNKGAAAVGGVDGTKIELGALEQAYAGDRKPVTRGATPVPAAVRLKDSAGVFATGELDGELESRS